MSLNELNRIYQTINSFERVSSAVQLLENNLKEILELQLIHLIDKLKEFKGISVESAIKIINVNDHVINGFEATVSNNLLELAVVPKYVKEIEKNMTLGKLLHVHHTLAYLEDVRDTLLYGAFRLNSARITESDIELIEKWFEQVDHFWFSFRDELEIVFSKWYDFIETNPEKLVTFLRIIEREEKLDNEIFIKYKPGYIPSTRPKRLNMALLNIIQDSVQRRVTELSKYEQSTEKCLADNLTAVEEFLLNDMKLIKGKLEPCFPPKYNIFHKLIQIYHNCVMEYLREIIERRRPLQSSELFLFLNWLYNDYFGEKILSNANFKFENIQIYRDNLKPDFVDHLETEYIDDLNRKYTKWTEEILLKEQLDWSDDNFTPQIDENDCWYSLSPIIIFGMIDENLKLASRIGAEFLHKIFIIGVKSLILFGDLLINFIGEFRSKLSDNDKIRFLITSINNISKIMEFVEKIEIACDISESLHDLSINYDEIKMKIIDFFLEDVITNKNLFNEILNNDNKINKLCSELDEQFQKVRRIRLKNRKFILTETEFRITTGYLNALLQKRTTFFSNTAKFGEKVLNEAHLLSSLFKLIDPNPSENDYNFNSLKDVSLLIINDDNDSLVLDLLDFVGKYPDIQNDHLIKLLNLKNNLSRNDIKELISLTEIHRPNNSNVETIFHYL